MIVEFFYNCKHNGVIRSEIVLRVAKISVQTRAWCLIGLSFHSFLANTEPKIYFNLQEFLISFLSHSAELLYSCTEFIMLVR